MKSKNNFSGRIFKVIINTYILRKSPSKSFLIFKNTIVLVLETDSDFSEREPCAKILVLTGEHKGKVGYEYRECFEKEGNYYKGAKL